MPKSIPLNRAGLNPLYSYLAPPVQRLTAELRAALTAQAAPDAQTIPEAEREQLLALLQELHRYLGYPELKAASDETQVPGSRGRSLPDIARSAAAKRQLCLRRLGGETPQGLPEWLLWLAPEQLAGLAERYEALSLVAARLATRLPHPHGRLLQLAATAQAALNQRLSQLGADIDADQRALFAWLSDHARRSGQYIAQHMQLSHEVSVPDLQAALLILRGTPEAPEPVASRAKEAVGGTPSPGPASYPAQVVALREYLDGRTLLMVGSSVDNQQHVAACAQAGIRVRWRPYRHAESHFNLEPDLRQPEVRVVVVAVRWSAHATSLIRPLCAAYGKDFVMLPAGYGLNTLAHEVTSQLGIAVPPS